MARPDPRLARARSSSWALGQIAYYKVPGYVAFVDALPLTATKKIQRAALKALAARLVRGSGDRRHPRDEEADRRHEPADVL